MRITINLLLKKTKNRKDGKLPIYLRCTLQGNRLELSTGIYVEDENWDSHKQCVIKTADAKILNNKLLKVTSNITDTYNQLEAVGEPFDIQTIKDKIYGDLNQNLFIETFEKVTTNIAQKIGKGYSAGTLKHYHTTLNRLKEFVNRYYKCSDIRTDKIDYHFITGFDTFLKTVHNIGPNTVWGYHRHLKKVLNDAIAMRIIDRNPYLNFKIKRVQANRDFLTIEEVKTIAEKSIDIDRIEVVRDIFIFACYTGLSYSDIAKLSVQHIITGNDGEQWIVIDREKTDARCRIPLLPKAKVILNKYQYHPKSYLQNRLLPTSSNQKMNMYLKEIADICKINKKLSMHIARHTFATSITLSNGVPIETVSKMLGHSTIKTTEIYAKIVDSKISDDMKRLKKVLD